MPRRESLAPIELKQSQAVPRRQSLVPKAVKKTPVVRQSGNSADSPVRAPVRAVASSAAITTPTRPAADVEPPAEIRCIVDKTAQFVAQNGLEFEQKILSNEKRNPKFNFLKSKDAYHSYYQRRILEFIDQGPSPQVEIDQVVDTHVVGKCCEERLLLVRDIRRSSPFNFQEDLAAARGEYVTRIARSILCA
ncbi:hypothetical protein AXG93_2587s1660 [Marchantia polymorpha subsp. ruderalis]|uniref:SURP motif domain-containing protein n=1 Tax=Marchantia polymorpha subsp. ruderalis TaxID=1480154 RepID=A0A176WS69_MARPO|nr:hypothetical protein AXG93_2587s1660 [Marchantia polymorpha subsp. ruderalis]